MASDGTKTLHDLRNMLNVVLGNAELLQQKTALTPLQRIYLDQILASSRRMADLLSGKPAGNGSDQAEKRIGAPSA